MTEERAKWIRPTGTVFRPNGRQGEGLGCGTHNAEKHLATAGIYDPLMPPKGLDRIDAELKAVSADEGAPDSWRLSRYHQTHFESAEMRAEVMEFLEKWL